MTLREVVDTRGAMTDGAKALAVDAAARTMAAVNFMVVVCVVYYWRVVCVI
jgi:hypothetical protein